MKILVVDDEALVRESLISSLYALQIADIKEAEDGMEAYESIREFRPDVIIADIRMPGMNGIELLSKVNEEFSGTIFIFISGYDLFEYAQKAVSLGAFSYLLKPIKDAELKDVLMRAAEKLENQSRQQELNVLMKIKMNQGLEIMKRRFIMELLTQNTFSENYLNCRLQELNINFSHNSFCVIIISLDDYCSLTSGMSPRDRELVKFAVENVASEVLTDHKISHYPFDIEDGHGFLTNLPHTISGGYSKILDACSEIQKCINKLIRYNVTIGIGTFVNSLNDLNASYESANKAVSQRLIKGGNQIIYLEETASSKEGSRLIGFKAEQDMLMCFERGDAQSTMELIRSLYMPFRKTDTFGSSTLKKLNFQLILLLFKILSQMGVNPEEILEDEFLLYNRVNSCSNIDSIISFFEGKLKICFEAISSSRDRGNKKVFEKAKEYIIKNYNKEITLEAVSEYIHLSPTYFSKLFKQVAEENFVDYVVNYRISKARELLKEGIYKANEVSRMVGFHDVKYFYKVFKKITGCTPTEYKEI